MGTLRRFMGTFAVLLVTSFGIVGGEPGTTTEEPSADVAHDHDGDGVPDHPADAHGSE